MTLRKVFVINRLWFARNLFFLIGAYCLIAEEKHCGNVYSSTIEMTEVRFQTFQNQNFYNLCRIWFSDYPCKLCFS